MGERVAVDAGRRAAGAVADPDQHDTSPMLAKTLFERPEGQERTTHQFARPITGEKVRFTNVEQEWPIGEFSAYYVHPGEEPAGVAVLRYSLGGQGKDATIRRLSRWSTIFMGDFPADERVGYGGDSRTRLQRLR